MNLSELKAAAELACQMPWEDTVPYLAKADFQKAFTPETTLALLAVVEAATKALHYHQGLAAICRSELSRFDEALRAALSAVGEEKNGTGME